MDEYLGEDAADQLLNAHLSGECEYSQSESYDDAMCKTNACNFPFKTWI